MSRELTISNIGFYWVKTWDIEGIQVGEWQVAFFTGEGWELCGNEQPLSEEFLSEIGDYIKPKDQPVRGYT